MAVSSFKNFLAELCTRRGEGQPTYVTNQVGGTAHQPVFESTCVLKEHGAFSSPGPRATKKDAEQAAAEVAFSILQAMQQEAQPYVPAAHPVLLPFSEAERLAAERNAQRLVLVDLENSQQALDIVPGPGDWVLGFVSGGGTAALDAARLREARFEVRVIGDAAQHLADVALVWHLATLAAQRPQSMALRDVYVISTDHFARPLVELGRMHGLSVKVGSWPQYVAERHPQMRGMR